MNEQDMQYHIDAMNAKDNEIYLLNVECEELQEEVGTLKREITKLKTGAYGTSIGKTAIGKNNG